MNLLLKLLLRNLSLKRILHLLLPILSRLVVFNLVWLISSSNSASEVLIWWVVWPILLVLVGRLDDSSSDIVATRDRPLHIWDVILSQRLMLLLLVMVIFYWLILTWVHWSTSATMAAFKLIIARSLFQRFSLLVINLAVTVSWHDGALLVSVTELICILIALLNLHIFTMRVLFSLSDSVLQYWLRTSDAVRDNRWTYILNASMEPLIAHVTSLVWEANTSLWTCSAWVRLLLLLAYPELE